MIYEVKGYQRYTGYDKVYFSVEAESPEEALKLVKEDPGEYYMDYTGVDLEDFEYINLDEWEVK